MSAHRLVVVAAALLPIPLLVPEGTAAPVADPAPVTLSASLELHGEGGANDVVVTVEPELGRIEVSPYYWYAPEAGRYVHVALGNRDGTACAVVRRVVVDTDDLSDPTAYDASGNVLPETEELTVEGDWAELVARVGIAPFAPVDCARATSYESPDPEHHGPKVWTGPVGGLEPVGYADIYGGFPLSVSCPTWIPYASEAGIGVTLTNAPGYSTGGGVLPHPSHLGSAEVAIEPGPFTVTAAPDFPTGIDLWTSPSYQQDLVVAPDDDQFFSLRLHGTFVRDGATATWSCGRRPISVPVPTDWAGSLAGTLWWRHEVAYNGGIGTYDVHSVYAFLDDTWVYVDDEYGGPPVDPCTEPGHDWPYGCHRYYYDDETGRLQIEDRRAKYANGGYQFPEYYGGYEQYKDYQVVVKVRTGQRFAYRGRSRWGSLVLRRDGSYHYQGWDPEYDHKVDWSGRYRFIGDDVQVMVLHHGRGAFRDGVSLYVWDFDGRTSLRDIDTHHRLFRFRTRA